VRIIVETIVAAIQAGLAHRETRRATPAETAAAAATGEVDLDKVIIPPNLKDVIEDKPVVKKRASRAGANKAAVTTDEV
jgi:small subunit ribosomal protein S2